ncbi:unnamed protein product [Rotaria sp. Silwood2]|nr:unnamed protein product [Rotaria sp. Silwood2]
MMNLLTRQSYLFQFENANSSVNLSYYGVVCDIAPGDYIIIHHNVDYMPDRVYTLSVFTVTAMSTTPLSASSNNGDWHYDNTTHIFSYIVKNPSSNTASMDVSANLNVIKCRYPNCQPPIQPGLALPVTARPANALYWSNDSHWSFASAGYGGYGKFIALVMEEKRCRRNSVSSVHSQSNYSIANVQCSEDHTHAIVQREKDNKVILVPLDCFINFGKTVKVSETATYKSTMGSRKSERGKVLLFGSEDLCVEQLQVIQEEKIE